MENIKVRKKPEILDSLPDAVTESDQRLTKNMYNCSSSLIPNKHKTDDNPASYVGWGRTDTGSLLRIEGEPRYHEGGKITLSLKLITVPMDMARKLGLEEEMEIPDYRSRDSQSDFLMQ